MKFNIFYSLLMGVMVDAIAGQTRPNIIFILADDLGFNDIGYHARDHQSAMRTPVLDDLAENGIKLENYYVQRICSPSRAQLLSGRHPIYTGMQHGVVGPNQRKALPLDNKLLPEQLRSCGYDTFMIGKWHLGQFRSEYLPHNRGFNRYFGLLGGSADYFTRERCHKGMCGIDCYSSEEGPVNNTWGEYAAHLFARKSIEAIENRDRSKPFFLYLSYQSPHTPIQAPAQYTEPFQHIVHKKRRTFAGMVLAMDESVGNLTQYLKRSGLFENTIIAFSTDNGGTYFLGGNNWPLRGQKKSLYEGGVRAVGFVHGKPLGVSGITHRGLIDISDWFPTFLRAANCPVVEGTQALDGLDQWDAIRQKVPSPRTEILHYLSRQRSHKKKKHAHGGIFDQKSSAALRFGPWKLITGHAGSDLWALPPESLQHIKRRRRITRANSTKIPRLYNIEQDPFEKYNIADQHPDVVRYMLKRLDAYALASLDVPSHGGSDPNADPKLHNGYWVPWLDNPKSDDVKEKSFSSWRDRAYR